MLTYQVRPRVFRILGDCQPTFPNDVEVVFTFLPKQPFGAESGGGLTAVQSQAASVFFNANTGQHYVESKAPLHPLEVTIEESVRTVELVGNRLTIRERVATLAVLRELVESIYFGLPLLLATEFADPVFVERVDGRIGDIQFRWELSEWRAGLDVTTQERQERRFADAWSGFDVVSLPGRRRLNSRTPLFSRFVSPS
jgi:hypothetical protein